jgi:hypothetical protein
MTTWTPAEAKARRQVLLDALHRHGGNITKAAGDVGVSRPTYSQAFRLGMGPRPGIRGGPARAGPSRLAPGMTWTSTQ